MPATENPRAVVDLEALNRLIPALARRGYHVIGPTLRDGAIVYDTLRKLEDLPVGWTDEQEAGRYRLKKRDDRALFGYVVWPQSWKKFLHPPVVRLFEAQRDGGTYRYPLPHSEEFWRFYAEDVNQFLDCARGFGEMVRAVGQYRPADQISEQEKRKVEAAMKGLQILAADTSLTLMGNNDGTFLPGWTSGSLIGAYALMALCDAAEGLLNVCDRCGHVFVSSAGRARFCSPRCRKTWLQRAWRERKVQKEGEGKPPMVMAHRAD